MTATSLNIARPLTRKKYLAVFFVYWAAVFILYLPTAKSGMVGDFPYYLDNLKKVGYKRFLMDEHSLTLYQTANLCLNILIKLFWTNPWPWHIVAVSLHAFNGLLLFIFWGTLLRNSGINNPYAISFTAAFFFIVCPHASEIVVWKSANYYLIVTTIIFLILVYTQKFLSTPKTRYALFTGVLFFIATFSHEFFYLTPWFVLALIGYYRFALNYDKGLIKKAFLYFFIPLLSLFILHLMLLYTIKHTLISHYGHFEKMPLSFYLAKPSKYLFHVLFMGRYFSLTDRDAIYAICESTSGIVVFYAMLACFWGYVLLRFKKVSINVKALALISVYTLLCYALLAPLPFANTMLVIFDRYTYIANGFTFMCLALLTSFIRVKAVRIILFSAYAVINICLTVMVNGYWKQSTIIVDNLMKNLPPVDGKIVMLLDLPGYLHGVPMIDAQEDGRFKIMMNTLTNRHIDNKVYDVASYNMLSTQDGAHVMVVADNMAHVTLNQFGNFWWRDHIGATSYETEDYKVNMADVGHWYELTIKHPASDYIFLYTVDD